MTRRSTRTVLLTGVTGNLGAFAAGRLLRRGDVVFALVRSREQPGLARRRALRSMAAVLPAPLSTEEHDRLCIVDADISDTSRLASLRLPGPVDETWHFASSLKYMPRDRDEIYAANVDGLGNVLALHRRAGAPASRFFCVSTAYLAGRGNQCVPEARIPFDPEPAFNNDYERSKLVAENRFLDAVEAGDVQGAVFRPSIVVGVRGSGRLVNYNGYYLGVEAWVRLDRHLCALGRHGERVRLWVDPANRLNLVPLDVMVDAMLDLAATGVRQGEVFNLVNARPPTLEQVFAALSLHLSITPVLCGWSAGQGGPKTVYEKLVGYSLTYTAPYMRQTLEFATGCARAVLGREVAIDMYPDELHTLNEGFLRRIGDRRPAELAGGTRS